LIKEDNRKRPSSAFEAIKTQLRKIVTEKYRNKFKEKLASYSDESKLFLYSKLKSSIGLEKYLSELTSFKNRQILTNFAVNFYLLLRPLQ
jgi:hypothetical protein